MNNDYPRGSILGDYFFIKNSIKNDLEEIAVSAIRGSDDCLEDIRVKCLLSAKKHSEYIRESVEGIYCNIKDALIYVLTKPQQKAQKANSRILPLVSNSEEKNGLYKSEQYSSEQKSFNSCVNASTNACRNASCNTYSTLMGNIISKTSSEAIKEAATVFAGKLQNSYSLKDRKPRRLWKWEDRIKYVESMFAEGRFSEYDAAEIEELRTAMNKNKYLKHKKPDCYAKLNAYLDKFRT